MKSEEPITPPPITEIPDYVWSSRYDKPSYLPGRPVKKPQEEGQRISHPNAEAALQAAKRSCRARPWRIFGRTSGTTGPLEFLVYENGKVIERHVIGR